MADPTVHAPAGYAPRVAISFGTPGAAATAVDAEHPLPVAFGSLAVDVRSAAPAAPKTAMIAAGASLSAAIDLAAERAHRIVVPTGWTTAAITFQSSYDGATFGDLHDANGEVTLTAAIAAGGRAVVVDPAVFLGVRYVKLRSGTAAAPVTQAAQRDLVLVTVPR